MCSINAFAPSASLIRLAPDSGLSLMGSKAIDGTLSHLLARGQSSCLGTYLRLTGRTESAADGHTFLDKAAAKRAIDVFDRPRSHAVPARDLTRLSRSSR